VSSGRDAGCCGAAKCGWARCRCRNGLHAGVGARRGRAAAGLYLCDDMLWLHKGGFRDGADSRVCADSVAWVAGVVGCR
jgi:hypothetical protein